MSDVNTKALNASVIDQLSTPGMEKNATLAITEYTRTKMREDGFCRRILPPQQITDDDLDRQVETDKPVVIVDKEPDSPAAISVPFGTLPNNRYIKGPRYRVMMDRILTPKFTKDIDELRTYDMDIRKILSDNSIKDLLAEEDGKWIKTVDGLVGTAGSTVTETNAVHHVAIADAAGPITRDSLAESMKIMPRIEVAHLTPDCALINNITIWDIVKFGRDETGGNLAEELLINGFAERKMLGTKWLVTIKTDLVPENVIYQFAEPKYLGKFFILEDTTMYIKREAFMLEFYAYETIGAAIGNVAGVTKATFTV